MEIIKHENHYLKALSSQRIVDMPNDELKKQVIMILAKTYLDAGKSIESKELTSLSSGLINEIKRYFDKLRIDELKICFENGLRGVYGDYFGLNVLTFHKWIKGFLIEDKRVEAIKIKNAPKVEVKPEPTEAEKIKIRDEFINQVEYIYKRTGYFGIYEASIDMVYKVLVETNKLSENDFESEKQNAYDDILIDIEERMRTNDIQLRRKLNEQKETLTMESKEVINMAKQLTIEQLWNQ